MTQTVYADILFSTNMLITYLLLSLVTTILRLERKTLRLFLGSALGGAFSFYILAPPQHFLIVLFIKLSFSAAIIFTAFSIKRPKKFFILLICFYTVSFAFAGIMLALWTVLKPSGMVINNSTVYFNVSVPTLLISCALCYLVIRIAQRLISRRLPRNAFADVTVSLFDKKIKLRAMIDTGNGLKDVFTSAPVIVASTKKMLALFPVRIGQEALESGNLPPDFPDEFKARFRLVPFRSVQKSGVLPAFRPDEVIIADSKNMRIVEKVLIACTDDKFSDSEFDAVIPGELCENII